MISKSLGLWHFFFALTFFIGASSISYASSAEIKLQSGDILLQPLNCWTCALIEAQERSPYSHMGLVLKLETGTFVLESLGSVKLTPLEEYLDKTQRGKRVKVLRFKDIRFSKDELLSSAGHFLGLSYDAEFLWDNYDEFGEKLYCSELITKVLYPFYGETLPKKRMRYDVFRDQWSRYFNGNIPDGKWGNAPADFDRSPLMYSLGEL